MRWLRRLNPAQVPLVFAVLVRNRRDFVQADENEDNGPAAAWPEMDPDAGDPGIPRSFGEFGGALLCEGTPHLTQAQPSGAAHCPTSEPGLPGSGKTQGRPGIPATWTKWLKFGC